ncbi:MAG TPA: class I SAM-dependent methyltransferase [Sinorhizobium sp.]|nr:class I SAM-dependent methyltransferase [Sinorhizobium sp.]
MTSAPIGESLFRFKETAKRWLRNWLPSFLPRWYGRIRRAREARRNLERSPRDVFAEIYREGVWGKSARLPFKSGTGSSAPSVVAPYVEKLSAELRSMGTARVVDLGCGDFTVSRQLVEHCAEYIGVDVVPELISHLQATHSDSRVRFVCLDLIDDELPEGDVCLIRQVLQHLSNDQILKVLAKLKRYDTVFITEHYPAPGSPVAYNLDKVHGASTRLYENSGVYLDRPPFNCVGLELMLEVPDCSGNKLHPGVIRTFRYRPRD